MKRLLILIALALAFAGLGRAAYRSAAPVEVPLSKFIPAGPLLYLETRDFGQVMRDWNASPQKKEWIQSDSYEVFSRSRLFLRLNAAGDQFAAAAGLPPDMNFLSEVAGGQSALAIYDIGKMQFLYITYLPSARSMQTKLWQTRSSFETRNSAGTDFYLRRDPQSQREVAFAVSGDYLLLATREDLMAMALQLFANHQGQTVEQDSWWAQGTGAAGKNGDLRIVLDMRSLVPNGYFRTYWVQQNITDLSQYSAAVSDLFRSGKEYREERVLIRKKETTVAPEGPAAVANLSQLVPDDAGVHMAMANPSPDTCFALLETKLLAPHIGPQTASLYAPQVQLTSGEQGSGSNLETRIDQAPSTSSGSSSVASELQKMLKKNIVDASLLIQNTEPAQGGVFVRIHSAIVLSAATEWNESEVHAAIAEFVRPSLTASDLGVNWLQKSGYQQLDGLLPVLVGIHGKELAVSDDPTLMSSVVSRFSQQDNRKPLALYAGFNHQREAENFVRLTTLVDRPGIGGSTGEHQPQFFSDNMASLSRTLADVSSERLETYDEGSKVRQTVTYEWAR